MKNTTLKNLLFCLFIAILLLNCSSDKSININADSFTSLNELINVLKPTPQTFTISDPTLPVTITGEDGLIIEIAGNTFTDNNNNLITTPITVKLTEHLTLKDMLLANAQTESNGQILVTGGSFNLIFEDQNGNGVNSQPFNIHSKIPVQTDITGYENDMQYFNGETNTVNGREVVDWENNLQAEAWFAGGIFNTIGVEQGLSNCDVLYDMTGDTPTQFEVTMTGVTDYSKATVWMVIEDFPSTIMIYTSNNTNDALATYANSIPTGLNATLIAMTVDDDSYLKFGSLPISVSGNDTFNIDMDYGTASELGTLIQSIAN